MPNGLAVLRAAIEEGRRVQMTRAEVPQPETFADLICYVSLQERATQIAHRNTGAHLPKDDKIGRNVLALVAGDRVRVRSARGALEGVARAEPSVPRGGVVVDVNVPADSGPGAADLIDATRPVTEVRMESVR